MPRTPLLKNTPNTPKYPTLKNPLHDSSESGTLQDVKNTIMDMNGQNLDTCTIKNLSTGQLLREATECNGLFTGFLFIKKQ